MGELEFMARLDRILREMNEIVREQVHQLDLIGEGNSNVETTWVEGDGITFLSLV